MEVFEKLYEYDGCTYPLQLKWDVFKYDDLILDIDKVRNWCRDGCPNYNENGGCPPFSPTADQILKDEEFILLIAKVGTSLFNIPDIEKKSKYIDDFLCYAMNDIGYKLKDLYKLDFLTPGHCKGCDICSVKKGCAFPKRRAYSITGTGIMLSEVMENLFKEDISWFTKDSEPKYVVKIMGILSSCKSLVYNVL